MIACGPEAFTQGSRVGNSGATIVSTGARKVERASAYAADHLQLDQAVELDRVLHRQLLGDRLDEAVDDHRRGLILGEAARAHVEELVVGDAPDGGLDRKST